MHGIFSVYFLWYILSLSSLVYFKFTFFGIFSRCNNTVIGALLVCGGEIYCKELSTFALEALPRLTLFTAISAQFDFYCLHNLRHHLGY